jgi:hypothetical protein
MGKLTGAVLVVAGVTIAVYAMAERQGMVAAESTASAVPGPDKTGAAETSTAPGTAPGTVPETKAKAEGAAAPALQKPPAPPPAAEKAPERKTLVLDKSTQTSPLQIAEAPPRVPVDHNRPARAVPLDHEGLTRAIQHHLKRVGCYGGAVNGQWTPAVRQAMKAFTDRVNATLPVERPDDILLALVQNHRQTACGGTSCPAGLVKDDDGKCRPDAVVARTRNANEPPAGDTGRPIGGQAGTPDERMSLAGPQPAQQRAARKKRSRYSDGRGRRRAPTPWGNGMPWWAGPMFFP